MPRGSTVDPSRASWQPRNGSHWNFQEDTPNLTIDFSIGNGTLHDRATFGVNNQLLYQTNSTPFNPSKNYFPSAIGINDFTVGYTSPAGNEFVANLIPMGALEPQFNGDSFAIPNPIHMPMEVPVPAPVPIHQVINQPDDHQVSFDLQPIVCNHAGCFKSFTREPDRARHERSIHGVNRRAFFCHVNGYPKSFGTPYSRSDKLKEHLWEKYANLCYRKGTA